MQKFNYTVTDPVGIHARPAGILVKECKKYQSEVTVSKGNKAASAKKLMALMGLGIKQGEAITVAVEGPDEHEAAAQLEAFFMANL